MRAYLILFLLSCFIGCRPAINMNDNAALCSQLTEMLQEDQRYRSLNADYMIEHYPRILDSLRTVHKMMDRNDTIISKDYIDAVHRKARQLAMYRGAPNLMNSDSIRELQRRIDIQNTRTLLRIVDKKGWVNQSSLSCENRLRTWQIFRHAPKKYWKRIRPLIEHERKVGRLGKIEYKIIDNHIQGRPPLILREGDTI